MSALSSGFPGTTTGPLSPPLSMESRASSRRPPLAFSAPWHSWQRAARTGRTFASKNSSAAGSSLPPPGCGSPAAATAGKMAITASTGTDPDLEGEQDDAHNVPLRAEKSFTDI